MNKKTWYVIFNAQFSDDSVEDEGEIVVPGGRHIMEAICERISVLGVTTSTPEQYSSYGWILEFKINKVIFVLLLQRLNELWFLRVTPRAFRFFNKHSKIIDCQRGINLITKALESESRFQEIKCMEKKECDKYLAKREEEILFRAPRFLAKK